MIITRTPFRISFAGGGSDLASYYKEFGGAVISSSIDKYIYLSMHPYFLKSGYFIKYSENETVNNIEDIKHNIIRETFRMYDIKGVDFNSSADIPSGSGLASSSAFTSGLVKLCNSYNETFLTKEEIAEKACDIEIDILQQPIGKQDQYACSCGGLNFIEFDPSGKVSVEKLFLKTDGYDKLEKNLLLFYTGQTRSASKILSEQNKNILEDNKKIQNLHKMVQLTKDLKRELLHNNIDSMGEILHQGWNYKKELSNQISNEFINKYYDLAMNNGATGGKLLGAGGGGFLLFYVKEENHDRIRKSLSDLKELTFKFDNKGTSIIHYSKHSLIGALQ
jgi:D-glycero-alpha-D-manno-heptose-7-phosphate kinase